MKTSAMAMASARAVARAASIQRRQHGAISFEQLLGAGVGRHVVARLSGEGVLHRVLPGVYVSAASPATRIQSIAAAALWGGPNALVSGLAAAELWGVTDRAPRIELLMPSNGRRRHDELVVHRTANLISTDHGSRLGIAVTSPTRTVIDCAASLSGEDLEVVLEEFLRRRRLRLDVLQRRFGELSGRGRGGSVALADLLAVRDPSLAPSNQRLEVKAWALLCDSSLPRPVRNHPVRVSDVPYELDFAWVELMVALETDGYSIHGGERAFRRDRQRRAALTAGGWRLVEATWSDITRPHLASLLLDRLGAVLAVSG